MPPRKTWRKHCNWRPSHAPGPHTGLQPRGQLWVLPIWNIAYLIVFPIWCLLSISYLIVFLLSLIISNVFPCFCPFQSRKGSWRRTEPVSEWTTFFERSARVHFHHSSFILSLPRRKNAIVALPILAWGGINNCWPVSEADISAVHC